MIYRAGVLLELLIALALGACNPGATSDQPATQQALASQPVVSIAVEKVRPAAVAGLFYPDKKETLAKQIDELLSAAKPAGIGKLRGLVVPHAGYRYSGPTAAEAYRQLVGRPIRTVVLMGPSHCAEFRGACVSDSDAYETPLGRLRVAALAKGMGQQPPFVVRPTARVVRPNWAAQSSHQPPARGEEQPDTWEHSLEVQVPFLQKTLPGCQIVPIVFGEVDPQAVARELANRLDDKTLLLASSDLSHYQPEKTARELDTKCVEAICQLDCQRMEKQEACGKQPILALMHVARAKGWKARQLDYRTSGDTTGDRSQVVGYAAIAFFDAEETRPASPPPAALWTPEERKTLLALARQSLVEAVRSGKPLEPKLADYERKMTEPRACFVTLTKRGELRGCIGHIFPHDPLVTAVAHNAASAALEDQRFPPVEAAELDAIDIEISILTLPEALKFESPQDLLTKLRPMVDGVVLRVGRRQSTYLPQVWGQLPDKEEFMIHLAKKAGLAEDGWKKKHAEVLVYQVEAFHAAAGESRQ